MYCPALAKNKTKNTSDEEISEEMELSITLRSIKKNQVNSYLLYGENNEFGNDSLHLWLKERDSSTKKSLIFTICRSKPQWFLLPIEHKMCYLAHF